MAAEALGFRFIYLEAGSGATSHVPEKLITMVKKCISIPLIVGGGIRDGLAAENVVSAGADVIVTGDVLEETSVLDEKLSEIMEGGRKGALKKGSAKDEYRSI
jgi:phosphoglycerol geranylgeranyltransferase